MNVCVHVKYFCLYGLYTHTHTSAAGCSMYTFVSESPLLCVRHVLLLSAFATLSDK